LQPLLSKYDRFVLTTPDRFYLCDDDLSKLDGDAVWTLSGEEYDQQVVASSRHVMAVLDTLSALLKDPERFKDLLQNLQTQAEELIHHHWNQQAFVLKQSPRLMFTCASDTDPATHKVLQGVKVKSEQQYALASETCGMFTHSFSEPL